MKCGCSIGIFLNSAHLVSRSVSEGPFDFEITRVDCTIFVMLLDQITVKVSSKVIIYSNLIVQCTRIPNYLALLFWKIQRNLVITTMFVTKGFAVKSNLLL